MAKQCINIHGDQSRASRGRVWCESCECECVCVCVCRARGEVEGHTLQKQLSRSTHNQHAVIFLSTSLCRLTLQQKRLHISFSDVSSQCVHTVDLGLKRTRSESHYLFTLITVHCLLKPQPLQTISLLRNHIINHVSQEGSNILFKI